MRVGRKCRHSSGGGNGQVDPSARRQRIAAVRMHVEWAGGVETETRRGAGADRVATALPTLVVRVVWQASTNHLSISTDRVRSLFRDHLARLDRGPHDARLRSKQPDLGHVGRGGKATSSASRVAMARLLGGHSETGGARDWRHPLLSPHTPGRGCATRKLSLSLCLRSIWPFFGPLTRQPNMCWWNGFQPSHPRTES
ncbi:unnamed protein product [Protopolystoma xenopodis]|uniref:Uncharacterized protein n=1 Tax=Protopolystoma xenopodis TaxID=117903 RepID=A0A3S5BC04_9PLAT|nr:unnamed protein product [Protopolystoma xenopodis]